MGRSLHATTLSGLILLCLLFLPLISVAQTPGLIYKIATNGGNTVLDPNGDGYTSKSAIGFQVINGIRYDEGTDYSEIPYRPFPVFMDEPLADLKTGGSYGHTDFAPKVYDANNKPVGSPLASYFDGKNFLFRVRLAGQSTASKGYSILIDIDKTLTGGSPNPGFEFEVLLATNFDVRVYDHRTNTTGGDIVFSGSVDQYSQKSIAGSTGGSDADYFYDFYVPMSAFKGAITETTPLRMTGVTITSAKSGIFGTASDLGGIDDNVVSGTIADAWKSIINNTPISTPTDIKDSGFTPVTATAPIVNSPIYTSNTTITGSSIEAAGSVVTVYRNGVSIGTTTVTSNGSWSFSLGSITLVANDVITAKVKPSLEMESASSTSVVVEQLAICNTPPLTMTLINGNKGFTGQTPQAGTVKVYIVNSSGAPTVVASGTFSTNVTWTLEFAKSGQSIEQGTYYSTFTPQTAGSCESAPSNYICSTGGTGNNSSATATEPTITQGTLSSTSLTLSGTATTASTTVAIYKNGVEVGRTTSAASATNSSYAWSYTYSQPVKNGDEFSARTVLSNPCTTTSAKSNIYTANVVSTAPTITGSYCGATTTVTGTSKEVAGTSIIVYVNNVQVGTTTVNSFGAWSATITSQSSGTITATATAPNKSVSAASAGVVINQLYTASVLSITGTSTGGTIYEGSTSVKGKAPAGAIVTLYINGSAYVDSKTGATITATAVSGDVFTFTNISPFELYAGAKLTVTAKASATASCESSHSAAVTVECNPVSSLVTAKLTQTKYCPGTPAYISLSSSEAGVIYNIYKNENGTHTQFGPSKLGTGAAITLQSDAVTIDGTKLLVKTIKVGAPCQYVVGSEMTVSLYPAVPKNFVVTATPATSACANVSTVITVQAAEAGYSYQLINNETKEKIGDAIVPSANGDISFPAVTVTKTTTYGVVIRGVTSGCVADNTILKTVTISGGPDVNRTITANQSVVCINGAVTIGIATENSYTYRIYQEGNATALATFTGTGNTLNTNLTDPFTTTGTKTFYATVSGGSCTDLRMTTTVTITVTDGTGTPVSAGPNAKSCGSSYTLAGSNPTPGTGTWSWVTKPALAADPTITTPSAYNSTVTGLVSGSYTFRWTVTSTCSGAMTSADVIIQVNCPAVYSTTSNKFLSEYVNGDVLATVTDPEGIKKVELVAGRGSLPIGTTLDALSGKISVSDASLLQEGSYAFNLKVTDTYDMVTEIPLSFRFYSQSIRPSDIKPLPVELVYFTATSSINGVVLQWLTASELDNDRFEIERSQNGDAFEKIGTVNGNGTSSKEIKYSFTDRNPVSGISYYRLKQVNFDGTYAYSKVIAIRNKELASHSTLQAYPNPFTDKLQVTITLPAAEQAVLTLYNLQGRELYRQEVGLEKGINQYEFNTQQLPASLYILKIAGNSTDITTKVLKK